MYNGRYVGRNPKDIPTKYIIWAIDYYDFSLEPGLRFELLAELAKREDMVLQGNEEDILKFRYPTIKPTRENIKFELSRQLKFIGINFYFKYRFEKSVFDMIILKDDQPETSIVAIIEFKNKKEQLGDRAYLNMQINRFRELGVPVIYCKYMNQIEAVIQRLEKILGKNPVNS